MLRDWELATLVTDLTAYREMIKLTDVRKEVKIVSNVENSQL